MNNNGQSSGDHSLGQSPLRVAYIMGEGRSGSTLLDTILGNHPDAESVGELCKTSEVGWSNGRYCACGQRATTCPFWSDVRREWAQLTGTEDEGSYGALVRRLERQRLWFRWEGQRVWLPRLAKEQRRGSPQFQEYVERTKALFTAIQRVSGKSIIVDSSKRASRAFLLSKIPGIDLRVIHLVRDVRGVVWSKKKRFKKDERAGVQLDVSPKGTVYTAVRWSLFNLLDEWVRRQLPAAKSMRVCYEDYVNRSHEVLSGISRLIDADLSEVACTIASGEPLETGHTVAGNRLRTAGRVHVRAADTEWVEELSPWDRWVCWTVAGRLMRYYGYRKCPDASFPFPDEVSFPIASGSGRRGHREMAA